MVDSGPCIVAQRSNVSSSEKYHMNEKIPDSRLSRNI